VNNVLITAALSRALDKISVEQAAILFILREELLPRSLKHPPSIPLRYSPSPLSLSLSPSTYPSIYLYLYLYLFRRAFIRELGKFITFSLVRCSELFTNYPSRIPIAANNNNIREIWYRIRLLTNAFFFEISK